MRHLVDPRLRLLVGTTMTEGNGVGGPTLHMLMTATVGAPIPTRTSTNPNADELTVRQ